MEELYIFGFGVLLSVALYMMMSRNLLRIVLGLLLLGNSINLAIFLSGRLSSTTPPLIPLDTLELAASANPLPQALILTAIVISFSLVAYTMVLFERAHQALHTMDPDAMHHAEPDVGTSWSGRA